MQALYSPGHHCFDVQSSQSLKGRQACPEMLVAAVVFATCLGARMLPGLHVAVHGQQLVA